MTIRPSYAASDPTPHNSLSPNGSSLGGTLNSLSIDGSAGAYYGTLDIGNSDLVIYYTGPDPYTTVASMAYSGEWSAYPSSNYWWNGTGLVSSLVPVENYPWLTIGLDDFAPGAYGSPSSATIEGRTITSNAILIRMTYQDDLKLAGDMSEEDAADDALIFAANYGLSATKSWNLGNLDYSDKSNSNDAITFASNYATDFVLLNGPSSTNGRVLFRDPTESDGTDLGGYAGSVNYWDTTTPDWYDPLSGRDVAWNSDNTGVKTWPFSSAPEEPCMSIPLSPPKRSFSAATAMIWSKDMGAAKSY